jgi:L-asparaginase
VLNVSQCIGGSVNQGQYYNSKVLEEIGVVGGGDITTEAAIVKMMFLLANCDNTSDVKGHLQMSLRGEITIND